MNSKIERVLAIFEKINSIPRKSKNEKEISDWLCSWAKDNGFTVERDDFLDVLIRVPATKGYEDKATVVFQGHMDMVCEKVPESNHDFSKDPIKMYQEDGWLKAVDTSLGADNGIALALAMDLVTDPEVEHPELELLFTVDEETGLTGAVNLPSNWLKGRKLINIDSEDEGVFTIGCAGGRDAKISIKRNLVKKESDQAELKVEVGGLGGGHSGVDIHLEKGNANIILARALKALKDNSINFSIVSIKGGSAHNAISRNAEAEIRLTKTDTDKAMKVITSFAEIAKSEFKTIEDSL